MPIHPLLFMIMTSLGLGWVCYPMAAWAYESPPPVSVQTTESDGDARYRQYTLPLGTPFHVLLQSRVHTAFNQPMDLLEAAMAQDLYLGAEKMISRDARFIGHIERLAPPMEGRNAILHIRFHELKLANGERIPVRAYIKTERPDHSWGGELTPGTIPKKITHRIAGIGDYNKTVWTGPRAMGQHIEFLPGERWTLILEEPITLVRPEE